MREFIYLCALALPLAARADLVSTITSAMHALSAEQVSIDADRLGPALIEALARTTDPKARLITSNELARIHDERAGFVFQAGLRLTMSNGFPVVLEAASNSPAARAGLRPGHVIASVGGSPQSNVTLVAASRLFRGSDETFIDVIFDGTNRAAIPLERRALPDIESAEPWAEDITYVKVNGIYSDAILARATEWTNRNGLIIDLRDAGGGNPQAAEAIADYCETIGFPVVALVDESTQGAAECLAAALASRARNTLIAGKPTSGDLLLRDALFLPSGEILYMKTFSSPTNISAGVIPDIVMADSAAAEYEPRTDDFDRRGTLEEELADRQLRSRLRGDPTLQRAVDILLGLKALDLHDYAESTDTDR